MSTYSASTKFAFASGNNAAYIEDLYNQYRKDSQLVDPSWQKFFEGYEFAAQGSFGPSEQGSQNARVEALINAYRRLGHLSAHLNPLEDKPELNQNVQPEYHGVRDIADDAILQPANLPASEMTYAEILSLLQDTYCRNIGADFREINNVEAVVWFQKKMEECRNRPEFTAQKKKKILSYLTMAEGFEKFLQDRYLGQKRFSLEGNDSLIPLMHFLAQDAAEMGVEEMNIGMAHRGRLNTLANFMNKHPELIFKEFEGTDFNPHDIDGDVKYHMGFAGEIDCENQRKMRLFLLPNPSHLEAVNPVVEGFARARQAMLEDPQGSKVLPLLMHGDAAFMGQGVVAETLNLSGLNAYQTGGTIHIIINNQIGFTAEPHEARSCTYSSEIAKMIRAPVLHVNADDPEAVVWTARLAAEYRQTFRQDIVIDLVGYRRHGHNETDEPMFTQPLMYQKIKEHPTCLKIYSEKLDQEKVISTAESQAMMKEFRQGLQACLDTVRGGNSRVKFSYPKEYKSVLEYRKVESKEVATAVDTTIPLKDLKSLASAITSLPSDFKAHPKIAKLFDARQAMMEGNGQIDWGMAELLAYASLASKGHPVRLSGQDSQRGTFSHRHAAIRDFDNGRLLEVLNQLNKKQAPVSVINSPLSETGVMGFEFGYSVAMPEALVLWEAQFGDFANGAQILIDQFLVASEAKWKQTCGLVLLLPHGYEGMGPEHSSARPERFLQLCGNLNIQLVNPTTPAQLFHLLRRQVLRNFRKPLVVMTPKSLLRHPLVISDLNSLSQGGFSDVIDDHEVKDASQVKRVVLCSGKVYYELREAREKQSDQSVAIVRIEQMYPFPKPELAEIISRYKKATDLVWAQEEPMNMGSWYFVRHRLEEINNSKRSLIYAGRKGSGTTAEGSQKAHQKEQQRIIHFALGIEQK